MADSTSTSIKNQTQPGLMSLSGLASQNLNPSTGGSTTPSAFLQTSPGGAPVMTAYGQGTTSPTFSTNTQIPTTGITPGIISPSTVSSNVTQPSVYQQNLSKYGLSSIPTGYSFNANGTLTNSAGQSYVAPKQNTNTQTSSGSTSPPASAPPSFPNVVNQLTQTASAPSSGFTQNMGNSQQAQTGLMNLSQTTPEEQAIQDQITNYGNSFDLANKDVSALEPGLTMGQVSGQQGALLNAYNTGLSRLQSQEGIAQTQQTQNQAGYNEAGGLANTAAGAATTQQGTQQSGLASAGSLIAPQQAGPTNVAFNPATNSYGPGAGSGYGPNGIGSASQVSGDFSAGQNYYSTLLPAFNQASSVLNGSSNNQGLLSFLQQNPNINPSSLNAANFGNQWLNSQFSNSTYAELGQYLNEYLQSLTPVIGSQGVSDYKSQIVQSLVNPTASTQSLTQQIQNLQSLAQGKMQATLNSFSGNANGTQSNTNTSGGTIFPTSIQ